MDTDEYATYLAKNEVFEKNDFPQCDEQTLARIRKLEWELNNLKSRFEMVLQKNNLKV